jgi:hypothetical protein
LIPTTNRQHYRQQPSDGVQVRRSNCGWQWDESGEGPAPGRAKPQVNEEPRRADKGGPSYRLPVAASVNSTRRSSAVTVRRPDPEVWRQALELADGDPRRVEVRDDGSVVVHNERIR